ncbi:MULTISPECIES: hypothetical protein [Streptacidiphilus]|uniref:Protein kilB n=1 Tax=Streptacidiphilus cavernicola TaxID=3342716 RepID=A0ABV6UXD9_9ACTN|nr:hypothetical protein [Streptacidiphilus jeojiense]
MTALLSSLIAVVGTLSGATLTFVFGSRAAKRAEAAARAERLREQQLEASSAFAAAAAALRTASGDRWHRRRESPDGKESFAIQDTFFQARTAAWVAYYRVRLVTPDNATTGPMLAVALNVIGQASDIHDADDKPDLERRRNRVSSLINEFVTAAAGQITLADRPETAHSLSPHSTGPSTS